MPQFDPLLARELDRLPFTLRDLLWSLGLGLCAALLVCLPLGAWLNTQV